MIDMPKYYNVKMLKIRGYEMKMHRDVWGYINVIVEKDGKYIGRFEPWSKEREETVIIIRQRFPEIIKELEKGHVGNVVIMADGVKTR